MVIKTRLEDSTGEILELLPVGTMVRHKDNPKLIGKIVGWEYHESGKVSPLPYKVYWDNWALARQIMGWFGIYPMRDEIVPINDSTTG